MQMKVAGRVSKQLQEAVELHIILYMYMQTIVGSTRHVHCKYI